MRNHTHGPWRWTWFHYTNKDGRRVHEIRFRADDGGHTPTIGTLFDNDDIQQMEADARLISSAPSLLDVARRALSLCNDLNAEAPLNPKQVERLAFASRDALAAAGVLEEGE